MAVRDIVNRELINLANCESEPIHIPGSVQPHGFLLAVDHSMTIKFCSANAQVFTGQPAEKLLNHKLDNFFPETETTGFRNYINDLTGASVYPFVFTSNEVSYNTSVHVSGDFYVLEFEPFPDGSLSLPNLYAQTRKFISLIEGSGYLRDLCQAVAEETRSITGYDRVMIYRFDAEYNGEVLAESKRDDLQSFIDHRYPHTDIPAQARALYMSNLLRMIADVEYAPVPLLTLDTNASNTSLDLSHSVLRSVSPIHIEYLKNMGVGATLTISLVHQNRLWGLIACHHYSPKNLPHYTRLAAQLQGHFLTSQISVLEVKEEYHLSRKVETHLKSLQELLPGNDFIQNFHNDSHLTEIAGATGIVIVNEGVIYRNGTVPADDELRGLLHWLNENVPEGTFHTDHLAKHYPAGEKFTDSAAGIIYHTLGKGAGDCIIWFRPEVVQTINWAGDPAKAVLKGENGMRLTPRKSFDLWREVVKNRSTPWEVPYLNATASFAYALQKHILLQYLFREEERYRKLSEKLQEANEELANINWISTHDLKEPLRKIQIFGSRIVEAENYNLPESVMDSVSRMRSAAGRMQALLDDILIYTRLNTPELAYEPVDLNEVLNEVQASLNEELAQKTATIVSEHLPKINGIPFQLQQLFINLISNALKFAKKEEPSLIRIGCEQINNESGNYKGSFYKIAVADNGIGFDNIYASRIFEVFQRLHTVRQYNGTGIGLSICRKIMTNHHGYITAEGEPDAGATFFLYFPVVPVSGNNS